MAREITRRQCPVCRKIFGEPMLFCPEHGRPLLELSKPWREGTPESIHGLLVDGKYRIGDPIGFGGMGTVFQVEHEAMGRAMAMKVLHQELSRQEQAVARFELEAQAASLLVHPHIVRVWDCGVLPDGRLYYVMELLSGLDLFEVLKQEQFIPPERTINIARQICAGLDEAHRHGIIHRDLKIENIFLAAGQIFKDFVKILDFGIAKWLEPLSDERRLTLAGMVFGNAEYLAPEHAQGLPIDHRADLYSLGVVLYRMLTGELPFQGPDKQQIIWQQLTEQPLPFRQRAMPQAVGAGLEAVVFRLLAKDPELRYQTAEEAQAALEQVAWEEPAIWMEY